MLKNVIGAIGIMFILFLFGFSAAMFMAMTGKWIIVQEEAQHIARSMGKYGGYTEEADRALSEFCKQFNLNESEVRANTYVSAPGAPVPWGTTVKAVITSNFKFDMGNFFSFEVPLTGVGYSFSTYLPGSYNVVYTSP